MLTAQISGMGHYVPENVVTNDDLSKVMDTNDQWITERTGIKQRRFYSPGKDTVAKMGAQAAKAALKMAGKDIQDIDFIVFATLSPEYYFPGSGVLLQRELGLPTIGALDVRAQCSGFIYGLSVADQYIKSGMYKCILLVGAEIHSNAMELSNRGRNVSVIFGDGAGAAIIEPAAEGEDGVYSTHLHCDGNFAEELIMEHPGSLRSSEERLTHEMLDDGSMLPHMNGRLVFMNAVKRFPEVIMEALNANGYKPEDLDMVIPHQANLRITKAVQQAMSLPDDKIYSNVQRYGNTTAASVPLALSEAVQEGKVKKGDLVCLAAFGSGFTWASALIRWSI